MKRQGLFEMSLTRANLTLESKKWLETHLWHAKRMKMVNMWGYRLVRPIANRPNQLRLHVGLTPHGKV